MRKPTLLFALVAAVLSSEAAIAQAGPAIRLPRITQSSIESGSLPLETIRAHGLRLFATPFHRLDGCGVVASESVDTSATTGRPMPRNHGAFSAGNGFAAQTCVECHSILSATAAPLQYGVGEFGGANTNLGLSPTAIAVADFLGIGFAERTGRFINPPFLLGSGGVELVAREMTEQLQALAKQAEGTPGMTVPLVAHGVGFGSVVYHGGRLVTTAVVGVDHDLVVRPFGRKGGFATVRAFGVEALQSHFGMQPVEVVGRDADPDLDGVTNEVLVGELSALHLFGTNLERPVRSGDHPGGRWQFEQLGCAECHRPSTTTFARALRYSFPVVEHDPSANVYFEVDLSRSPASFATRGSGVEVEMFSDLKRHDMGPGLADRIGDRLDTMFATARLWGVADTAPYLHDGRALTLEAAILAHGGEARVVRDNFARSTSSQRAAVIGFLKTLRTPIAVAMDLDLRQL